MAACPIGAREGQDHVAHVVRYTGSQAVYRLAAGYRQGGLELTPGDHYVVSVKGAKSRGVVK